MFDFFKYKKNPNYNVEGVLDLGSKIMDVNMLDSNDTVLRVQKGQEGRLDKIGLFESSDLDVVNQIMYYNHIFNPFAIEEGDFIDIPNYNSSLYSLPEEIVYPETENSGSLNGSTQNNQNTQTNLKQNTKSRLKDQIKAAANKLKHNPDKNRKERLQRLANSLPNGKKTVSENGLI